MKAIKKAPKLVPFDAARYLNDEAAIAEYMTVVLETEDPDRSEERRVGKECA